MEVAQWQRGDLSKQDIEGNSAQFPSLCAIKRIPVRFELKDARKGDEKFSAKWRQGKLLSFLAEIYTRTRFRSRAKFKSGIFDSASHDTHGMMTSARDPLKYLIWNHHKKNALCIFVFTTFGCEWKSFNLTGIDENFCEKNFIATMSAKKL